MWGVIKRDLAEFVTVVKTDAQEVVVAAVNKENEEKSAAEAHQKIPFDTKIASETPLPSDKVEFDDFSNKFDVGGKTTEISQFLQDDIKLKNVHAELVPDTISYKQFWLRYYFLLTKASKKYSQTSLDLNDDDDEEDLDWDQDEDDKEEDEESDKKEDKEKNNNDPQSSSSSPSPSISSTSSIKTDNSISSKPNNDEEILLLKKEFEVKEKEFNLKYEKLLTEKNKIETEIEIEKQKNKNNERDSKQNIKIKEEKEVNAVEENKEKEELIISLQNNKVVMENQILKLQTSLNENENKIIKIKDKVKNEYIKKESIVNILNQNNDINLKEDDANNVLNNIQEIIKTNQSLLSKTISQENELKKLNNQISNMSLKQKEETQTHVSKTDQSIPVMNDLDERGGGGGVGDGSSSEDVMIIPSPSSSDDHHSDSSKESDSVHIQSPKEQGDKDGSNAVVNSSSDADTDSKVVGGEDSIQIESVKKSSAAGEILLSEGEEGEEWDDWS